MQLKWVARQIDQTSDMQLGEQRPRGHVLEPTGSIAPRRIIARERAALEADRFH